MLLKVGQRVRIRALRKVTRHGHIEDEDDTFNVQLAGRIGRIQRLITESAWPVGESPTDPLYIVSCKFGQTLRSDGFWEEELIPLRQS